MRWQIFAIFAFVFMILELGLRDLLGMGADRSDGLRIAYRGELADIEDPPVASPPREDGI